MEEASALIPCRHHGYRFTGPQSGITLADWVMSLLVVTAARTFLRQLGIRRRGLALATMLSLYPDFLLSYSKVQDTNLTAFLIFGFPALLLAVLPG